MFLDCQAFWLIKALRELSADNFPSMTVLLLQDANLGLMDSYVYDHDWQKDLSQVMR